MKKFFATFFCLFFLPLAVLAMDSDIDGVSDDVDICPKVYGDLSNNGCPVFELYEENILEETMPFSQDLFNNQCLYDASKTRGIIYGEFPTCNSCPCSVEPVFQKEIRSCDLIFPVILDGHWEILGRGDVFIFNH